MDATLTGEAGPLLGERLRRSRTATCGAFAGAAGTGLR